MSCLDVPIQTILGTECIGDSLPKIMGNFNTLGDAACDLITKVNVLSSSKANLITVVDSPTIDLSYNSTTGTLSANANGYVYVPLYDPISTTNCGVEGAVVLSYSATGNTTLTDFTGATQTIDLSLTAPTNARIALIGVETNNNTNETLGAGGGDVYIYFRKNSSDSWRLGLYVETMHYTIEANQMNTFPITFDYDTKSFQAYLFHNKLTAPASNPSYTFTIRVLGYYIK